MRPWRKYWIDPERTGQASVAQDAAFRDHEKSMGGYAADESYQSHEAFFRKHYLHAGWGRCECCDHFLRRVLRAEERALSVASGPCVNELKLIADGYDI